MEDSGILFYTKPQEEKEMDKSNKPILVFQTDFTYKEGAVCAMYGVVKSVDRELEIFDGTHEIPQYDIWSASYRLLQSVPFWPKGTIFVSVVDPGVGTSRRACVAKTANGYYIVTPDNGSLTHIKEEFGITEMKPLRDWVGKSIHSLQLRSRYGVNVIGLRRGDNIQIPPDIETPLEADSTIVLLGSYDNINALKKE